MVVEGSKVRVDVGIVVWVEIPVRIGVGASTEVAGEVVEGLRVGWVLVWVETGVKLGLKP